MKKKKVKTRKARYSLQQEVYLCTCHPFPVTPQSSSIVSLDGHKNLL